MPEVDTPKRPTVIVVAFIIVIAAIIVALTFSQ